LLGAEGVFFSATLPAPKFKHFYSLAWGGLFAGEDFNEFLIDVAEGLGVKALMDRVVARGESGFKSVPMSLVMADNSGDIAYMMLAAIPNRRDRTPHIGNRVLDGTTSAYDWDGLVPVRDLPMGFNPKKGYFSTANNRVMPENSLYDIGGNAPSTGRAQRIDEILSQMIKDGHKITVEDMLKI